MIQSIWLWFLDLSIEIQITITGMLGAFVVAIAKVFSWWDARRKLKSNANPNISLEQHVTNILSRVKAAEDQLKISHAKEQNELRVKITELQNRLANPEKSFEDVSDTIKSLLVALDRERPNIDANRFAKAKIALEAGTYADIDAIFSDVEYRETLAIEAAARAAFVRGEIAEQEIRWQDAAQHYRNAVARRPNFKNTFKASRFAAYCDDYDMASTYAEAAIKLSEQEFGKNSWEHAGALIEYGVLLTHLAKYARAEPILMDGIKIAEDAQETTNLIYTLGLLGLSGLYQSTNRLGAAEEILRKVITAFQDSGHEINSEHATALNNLSLILKTTGRVQESEERMRQSGELTRELYGEKHPQYARYLNNLGTILQSQNRFNEAKKCYCAPES